ncbi:MAG TPA: hypothetical protein VLK32_00275 [Bacillota bacterium]|nr:hypothetical protein [Bacillota bacterium]
MRFVVELCKALDELQQSCDGFRLTMGVGVVFAKPTIPIHRLHEVAESLVSSAKRRFRGSSHEQWGSVVDWAVYTTTWVADLEEVRTRDWLRGSEGAACVLSRRPMRVLGDGLDSLQGLVQAAGGLKNAPRSQLRHLVDQLPRGKALSELAFQELSLKACEGLKAVGISEIWTPGDREGSFLTSVLDLVDVFEIYRLGHTAPRSELAEDNIVF